VESIKHKKIVDVSVGSLHCIVCSEDGDVYTWGDNDEGQVCMTPITLWSNPR